MATTPIADHCANLLKGTTSPRLSEVHRNLRGQYAIYLHSCPDGTPLGNSTKPPPGTHSSHPPDTIEAVERPAYATRRKRALPFKRLRVQDLGPHNCC